MPDQEKELYQLTLTAEELAVVQTTLCFSLSMLADKKKLSRCTPEQIRDVLTVLQKHERPFLEVFSRTQALALDMIGKHGEMSAKVIGR